jgi:drug/metabolite transporter (DMT)-like permease
MPKNAATPSAVHRAHRRRGRLAADGSTFGVGSAAASNVSLIAHPARLTAFLSLGRHRDHAMVTNTWLGCGGVVSAPAVAGAQEADGAQAAGPAGCQRACHSEVTMADRALRMGAIEWSLLLTLSVLWGGSFFFVKVAVAELPPFTVVLARVGLAALALNILVRVTGGAMPRDRASWFAFVAMGMLNNLIPFSLTVWAQTQISSGLASILNGATPLFAVILAHWSTADERLSWNRLIGVLLGFAGVTVMIGGDALAGIGLHVVAALAVLAATLSYACAGIFGRRFKHQPPLVTATGQVTAASILTLPIVVVVDRPWTLEAPQPATWGAVVGLALLSTALAYMIFFRILATAGATNLLLVTLLIPVSAVLLGHTVLDESVRPQHIMGMALIALGLAAIDGRAATALRQWRITSRRRADARES